MSDSNKKSLLQFAKTLLVFILGFVVLIPNVEIWNLASEGYTGGFHIVVSILNLLAGGTGLLFFSKKILFKKTESDAEEKTKE